MKKICVRLIALVLLSCSPQFVDGPDRVSKEEIRRFNLPRKVDAPLSREILDLFYEAPKKKIDGGSKKSVGSCEWIQQEKFKAQDSHAPRFRLVERAEIVENADLGDVGSQSRFQRCFFVCSLHFFNFGSNNCQVCLEEENQRYSIKGRIDIVASPLYHFAITSEGVYDGERFKEEIDKFLDDMGLFDGTIARLYAKFAIKDNDEALFAKRNEMFQSGLNEAFPGLFDQGESYDFRSSFPGAMLLNGIPDFESLMPQNNDSPSVIARKRRQVEGLIQSFTRPLKLFWGPDWGDFQKDVEASLNIAIRGFQSRDPAEQSCSAILLHRMFSQFVHLIGYDELPVIRSNTGHRSSLYSFAKILNHPHGSTYKVCPKAGSFQNRGSQLQLTENLLSEYSFSQDEPYGLSKEIYLTPTCSVREAAVLNSRAYKDYRHAKAQGNAEASQWVSLISSVIHTVVGYFPGADWWKKSRSGYPLSVFQDLEQIQKSQGVLPSEAHLVAVGLLQLGAGKLLHEHLVQIDQNFKEATEESARRSKDQRIIGLRLSEAAHQTFEGGVITTKIDTVMEGIKTALKFSAYLDQLPAWWRRTKSSLTREKKLFIESLFGSTDHIERLAQREIKEGEDPPLFYQLQDLNDGLALLLASFAQRDPQGEITCYTEIHTDLGKGEESKKGRCSPSQERLFKSLCWILARIYQSPLFAEYAATRENDESELMDRQL